jgi:hypothetical protein
VPLSDDVGNFNTTVLKVTEDVSKGHVKLGILSLKMSRGLTSSVVNLPKAERVFTLNEDFVLAVFHYTNIRHFVLNV